MRVVLAVAVLCNSLPADAGGMLLPVRGIRSIARGGAFVAGAEDADALWQNPAGLAHAHGDGRRALLFDIGLVYQPVEYTALDGSTASNEQPSNPVPSLAGSLGIGDRLVIGGGLSTPYMALHRYGAGSAARFQSVSWTGSAFVLVTAGAAYRVTDRLRVGATIQNQFSKLAWSIVATACPPMQTCDPDDRTYEMPIDIAQTDYVSPSGSLGVQFDATPAITLGLAIDAPRKIAADGTLTAKLPTSTDFTGGRITGDAARVSFTLPAILRAGLEARLSGLRVEASLGAELWSMQDAIEIAPDEISIENVVGGPYPLRTMTVEREQSTSITASVGAEVHGERFMAGCGLAYETAATEPSHVSVLAVDTAKTLLAIGGGYSEDGWQITGALAFVRAADVTVDDPRVDRLVAIQDAPAGVRANGGSYSTSFLLAGLRVARRW